MNIYLAIDNVKQLLEFHNIFTEGQHKELITNIIFPYY